jgi:hypothetical protein
MLLVLAGIPVGTTGWLVTDRLEQDDDFCNACHLSEDTPLHLEKRRDFDTQPPASLAAAHAVAEVEGRDERVFRCIDCHGGVGIAGRLRVKLLSAKDAFWYVVGHFEEPKGMRWPLLDADCSQCHASFEEAQAGAWRDPKFHELAVHNAALGMGCVECHLTHEPGGLVDANFLHPAQVRSRCAECHPEFEEEEG